MPQPPDVEAAARALADVYARAWEAITAELEAIADDPSTTRQRRRLRGLRASVEREMGRLDAEASAWLRDSLPEVYERGALAAAEDLGEGFEWAQHHREALAELARDTHDDLLAATRYVRRDVKRLVREQLRAASLAAATQGKTAQQAAREAVRRVMERRPLHAVVYSDGSRHGLAEYADVVVRTKTAVAYNAGTLNHARSHGVAYFEVFDGSDCGLTSHNDPDKANGTIRTAEEVAAHPISHPRCQRAIGPRPDIASAEEAASARPTTTEAQRADQAASEAERRRVQRERRNRRARRRRRSA